MSNTKSEESDIAACNNCKYCSKAIGLGLGFLCKHPSNIFDDNVFHIPHQNYSCEFHSPLKTLDSSKN